MAQLNLNTVRQNIESRLATEMASNPATASLIAAFVPSGFGAKIKPGER